MDNDVAVAELVAPFLKVIDDSRERLARAVRLDALSCVVCGADGVVDESRHCRSCDRQRERDDQAEVDERDAEYRRSR